MYTEEHAKLLRCPHDVAIFCLASKCMAWRWEEEDSVLDTLLQDEEIAELVRGKDKGGLYKRGFCGLSGRG